MSTMCMVKWISIGMVLNVCNAQDPSQNRAPQFFRPNNEDEANPGFVILGLLISTVLSVGIWWAILKSVGIAKGKINERWPSTRGSEANSDAGGAADSSPRNGNISSASGTRWPPTRSSEANADADVVGAADSSPRNENISSASGTRDSNNNSMVVSKTMTRESVVPANERVGLFNSKQSVDSDVRMSEFNRPEPPSARYSSTDHGPYDNRDYGASGGGGSAHRRTQTERRESFDDGAPRIPGRPLSNVAE